jgi:hypothetical protein
VVVGGTSSHAKQQLRLSHDIRRLHIRNAGFTKGVHQRGSSTKVMSGSVRLRNEDLLFERVRPQPPLSIGPDARSRMLGRADDDEEGGKQGNFSPFLAIDVMHSF